jgi:Fic family protein
MGKYEEIVSMWQGWNISTVHDLDEKLHNFRILFAYNSGRIENDSITYHDTREIFENGRAINFTGDPRALFEQRNQKICYELLKNKIIEKVPLTVSLVLEIHEVLTSGTYDEQRFIERGERPGTFKKHDYVIGREEAGSLPANVPGDITALIDEMLMYKGNEILKAAAYFHLRFEHIHPFADGNGRTGRTLLNYFLMSQEHPPIIIYDENKAEYYEALEIYDKTEDIIPMYNFLRRETEHTWEKTLERQ